MTRLGPEMLPQPRALLRKRSDWRFDRPMIQPGWEVWTSDGEMLGHVVRMDEAGLRVKKQGFFGGEVLVPRDTVREEEERRVEVTLTKQQATAG